MYTKVAGPVEKVRDDIRGPKWNLNEVPNLTGKVALVTGANSSDGIGYHTAHQMALKGAKVYLGARNETKALEAIEEMKRESPSIGVDQLHSFVADMGDLKAVKAAAQHFLASESRLDILVNNAGLLARPLDIGLNGISVSFTTNHLAPFVLTTELLPLLKRTAASNPGIRVVALSSTTHGLPPKGVRYDSIDAFNAEMGGRDGMPSNLVRYGLSKVANILFAKQLQKVFDAEGIQGISISLHPGGVKTKGSIKFVGPSNLSMLDNSLSPLEGAMTSLFAATHPKVWQEQERFKGAYLMPFGVVEEPSEDAKDEGLAEELWRTSEVAVKNIVGEWV